MLRPFALSFICLCIACLTSCSLSRSVWWNVPGQRDTEKFPSTHLSRSGPVTEIHPSASETIPPIDQWAIGPGYKPGMSLEDLFRRTDTKAFLVLRGDTMLYEFYAKGWNEQSVFTSFSMAKVWVSTLVAFAIQDSLIDSLDQRASDFLPELRHPGLEAITIRHLLDMRSGIKSSESLLNPFGTSVKMYYTRNLDRMMSHLHSDKSPGSTFKYQNINTQLLSMIIARQSGKTLAQYAQEKLWTPLGMESDASWSLDRKDGTIKAFCCLNAHARDYARFGMLYADSGRWQGRQLVPEFYMKNLYRDDTLGEKNQRYRMHWYTSGETEDYYGEGLLGQFTYVCPKERLVIVRLGNGIHTRVKWYSMFKFLAGLEPKPFPKTLSRDSLRQLEGNYTFGLSNIGDVGMKGKTMKVKACRNGIKIATGMYPRFKAFYCGDMTFYNVRNARKISFIKDAEGKYRLAHWYRRGNSWDLPRAAE